MEQHRGSTEGRELLLVADRKSKPRRPQAAEGWVVLPDPDPPRTEETDCFPKEARQRDSRACSRAGREEATRLCISSTPGGAPRHICDHGPRWQDQRVKREPEERVLVRRRGRSIIYPGGRIPASQMRNLAGKIRINSGSSWECDNEWTTDQCPRNPDDQSVPDHW